MEIREYGIICMMCGKDFSHVKKIEDVGKVNISVCGPCRGIKEPENTERFASEPSGTIGEK